MTSFRILISEVLYFILAIKIMADQVTESTLKITYGQRNALVKVPSDTSLAKLKETASNKFCITQPVTLEYFESENFNEWVEVDDGYQLPAVGKLKVMVYDDKGEPIKPNEETESETKQPPPPENGDHCETGNGIKPQLLENGDNCESENGMKQPSPPEKGGLCESENRDVHSPDTAGPVTNDDSEGSDCENDEDYPEIVPYCTEPVCEDSEEEDEGDQSENVGDAKDPGAYGQTTKMWRGEDVLSVYFINPDSINCGKYPLTIETILALANKWSNPLVPAIPNFVRTYLKENTDIRVKFGSGRCWSKVGTDAKLVTDKTKPTMNLSLKDLPPDFQQYLVIHEFGHSLGLLHEHQRSDFWTVMSGLIDMDKIRADSRMRTVNLDVDILALSVSGDTTPYDPDSIMHYWFDVKWLVKEKHKKLKNVLSSKKLTPDQKTFLEGIHKRNNSYASGPSKEDLKFLQKHYERKGTTQDAGDSDNEDPPTIVGKGGTCSGPWPAQSTSTNGDEIDKIASRVGIDPKHLDSPFAEDHLIPVAKLITNWEVYARLLFLTPVDIQHIETNRGYTIPWQKAHAMLSRWRGYCGKYSEKGHYRHLLKSILEATESRSLVEDICGVLKKK